MPITIGKTEFNRTVLDNGLKIVTSSMIHSISVSVNIFVGVGSRYENPENAGISHLVEHLVFKGTVRRPSPKAISSLIEGVGGVLNAGTEHEFTVYWCQVVRQYMDKSIDLLIDMLRNSLFEPDELERERLVVFEEQRMVNDYPDQRVDALMAEMLWPNHPLGRDVCGSRESVGRITREMVMEYMEQFYNPENMVVSVAGDIQHEQVVDLINQLVSGWDSRSSASWTNFSDAQLSPKISLEYRKTEQAHLSLGLPGLSITHPDRYALDLVSVILGEGMSSRLFLEMRERQGLAYDVHSGVTYFLDCGAFVVNAGVDPSRVQTAVDTILAELSRMKNPVMEEDLQMAKQLTIGRLLLRMEGTRPVADWIGMHEALLGQIPEVQRVIDRIKSVTVEDLQRVSVSLLNTTKLNLALVGPVREDTRLDQSLKSY